MGPYWIERSNCTASIPGNVICNLANWPIPIQAIGTRKFNSGNWPIGNSTQFNSPNSNEGNSLIGFAEEAEIDEAVMRPACLASGRGADAGARCITAVAPYLCYARKYVRRIPQPAIGGPLPACVL